MSEDTKSDEMQEQPPYKGGPMWWGPGRGSLWPGLMLILLGLIFLTQNYLGFKLENWWALFILLPALGNLAGAWESYRRKGRFDRGVRARIFWGMLLAALAFTFLLDLNFGLLWPAFLIIAGLGLLFGAF